MVLKLMDRPKFVEHPVRIDPYEEVMKTVNVRNYAKLCRILKGETHPRDLSVFPAVLQHLNPLRYIALIRNAKKNSYAIELTRCFTLACRLARQFNDSGISNLEKALQELGKQPEPTTRIREFPYECFEHAYETYQNEPRQ